MHYSNVGYVYHLRGGDVGEDNRCRVMCGRYHCTVQVRISNANDGRQWVNAQSKFKRCGGCFEVSYCSRECKRLDWVAHKDLCDHWRRMKRQSACPTSSVIDYRAIPSGRRQTQHRSSCRCGSDSCH